jgi:type IV pilus assembly protein PilV
MMTTMQKNAGFTLLEVVVAMSIFAIGSLSLAMLQATAMKVSSSALLRSQATNYAEAILDAMRANRTMIQQYGDAANGCAPASAPSCTITNLTGSVVQRDCAAWTTALACTFQNGTGSVAVDPATSIVTVTIQWDSTRGQLGTSGTQTTDSFRTVTGL